MYCRNCGKEIADSAKFCKYCGTQVFLFSHQPECVVENVKPRRKRRRGWLLISFIILCLLTGGGVFVCFGTDMLQGIRNPEPEKTQEELAFQELEEAMEDMDFMEEPERGQERTEAVDEEEVSLEGQIDESPIPEKEPVEERRQDEDEEVVREYILPESDSVFLSMEDLEGLSAEECRLARNEIYARHGRLFTDEMLQEYFYSLDWYEGTVEADEFDESVLNEYETANRDLIVMYEKEQGYR